MTSNVYHVHFMDDQLPPDPADRGRYLVFSASGR